MIKNVIVQNKKTNHRTLIHNRDETLFFLLFIIMTSPNPIIKFSFDTYISGTTVQNEGTLGSTLDAMLYNSLS